MSNEDLRKQAMEAIANYMHHELFEITGDTQMLPWLPEKASELLSGVDSAIAKIKTSPLGVLAREVKKQNG